MQDRWEHFEHGADIGVRGIASTKSGAFEQAALALTAVVTDPKRVEPCRAVEIVCRAADEELLLARWLNRVISEMSSRHMLFSQFEVRLEGSHLHARAFGESVSARKHHPTVEPKGATCTALRVAPHEGGWLAQTVVDV